MATLAQQLHTKGKKLKDPYSEYQKKISLLKQEESESDKSDSEGTISERDVSFADSVSSSSVKADSKRSNSECSEDSNRSKDSEKKNGINPKEQEEEGC